jgi:uncharacterized protein with HEPN domain
LRDDHAYLSHIVDAIDKVAAYISVGEEEFPENTMVQDAVIRNLEIIGEAVRHLSPALKASHQEIPWRRISGMRDKLIHQYFGVKLEVVWETAVTVLPDFRSRISNLAK